MYQWSCRPMPLLELLSPASPGPWIGHALYAPEAAVSCHPCFRPLQPWRCPLPSTLEQPSSTTLSAAFLAGLPTFTSSTEDQRS